MSILVLGGGPAGAASACLLAEAGRAVTLVERNADPTDKLCGEFIAPAAAAHLAALGIDLLALGAQPITHVRLVKGRHRIESPLPFRAFGLTRRTLDEALLRKACERGAALKRGSAVRQVAHAEQSFTLQLDDGDTLAARTLFLASGKHGVRGLPSPAQAGDEGWLGFKTYFDLAAPARDDLSGHIELVLFRGGYAGLQLVDNGIANLCLLVRRSAYLGAGGGWDAFLAMLRQDPHLGARLDGAVARRSKPLAIAGRPYGFLHSPTEADPPRLFRLGDQAAIIEPFVGDGISIALHSAHLAVAAHLAGQDAADYHRRLRRDVAGPIRRAQLLAFAVRSRLSGAALRAVDLAGPGLIRGLSSWARLAA